MNICGYIYLRTHNSYNEHKVIKLGETSNLLCRDSTYTTGEYIKGTYVLILKMLSHDSKLVEKILKKYFKKYNKKNTGGTEFFKIKIQNKIISFLDKTNIKYKKLNIEDINKEIKLYNILQNEKIKKMFIAYIHRFKLKHTEKNKNSIQDKSLKIQEELQQKYIDDIIPELKQNKKVFIKAPTGFGKTHIYYKVISSELKPLKILIFTPRKLLNIQMLDDKYTKYIKDDNFKILHFSESDNKEKNIKKIYNNNNFIITSCYQSNSKLYELIKKYNISFDLIIFDEAHFISKWINDDNIFLTNNITKYRIFGSATPPENYKDHENIFGKIIDKVQIYELINNKILCDIETIVKKLDNKKSEYHNLKDLIVESMKTNKKRKGIIYVNNTSNAENLYNLMKKSGDISTYIYVSKNIETEDDDDTDINAFENDTKQSIIIVVGKLGYGYDNPDIDFLCLGDPRQSDIDIRQIIGRGLRWNKDLYPNKILHLLVPLYKDEFNSYKNNSHLKKYLDYIIGECGHDIIFKNNGDYAIGKKKQLEKQGDDYSGDNIPIEILKEYCTTGYNKFTDFERFLKSNKIYNETTYNDLRDKQEWLPILGNIRQKYPKFCFKNIHPNSINYYINKKEAKINIQKSIQTLKKQIGVDNYSDLTEQQILKKINVIDNKIPLIDVDLYYPIE
jgi:superfamily II DNA or RNA helicase